MTFIDLQNQPPTSITATCMRIKSVASFNGSDLIRFFIRVINLTAVPHPKPDVL